MEELSSGACVPIWAAFIRPSEDGKESELQEAALAADLVTGAF
jgi:hypothetical protein